MSWKEREKKMGEENEWDEKKKEKKKAVLRERRGSRIGKKKRTHESQDKAALLLVLIVDQTRVTHQRIFNIHIIPAYTHTANSSVGPRLRKSL